MSRLRRNLPSRIARGFARTLGWMLVGVVALVSLAFTGVNLSPVKNYLRETVNSSLAKTFVGSLRIDRIGYVGLTSIGGVDARAYDATRRQVLEVRGLEVKSIWPHMLKDLIAGSPLRVTLEKVTCDHVVLTLLDDGNGSPSLAEVFLPRTPGPESNDASTTSILLPDISIRHLWAHGNLPAAPTIDAELFDVGLALAIEPSATSMRLEKLALVTRGLPGAAELRGRLRADGKLPADEHLTPTASVAFEGEAFASPTELHFQLVDGQLRGALHVDAIPPDALRAFAPTLAVTTPTRLDANIDGALPDVHLQASVANAGSNLIVEVRGELDEPRHLALQTRATVEDARQWVTDAPPTRLGVTASVDGSIADSGELMGAYAVELDPMLVSGERTPPLFASGALRRDTRDRFVVMGDVTAIEPGVALEAKYRLSPDREDHPTLDGNLRLALTDAPRVSRMLGIGARGTVTGQAEYDFDDRRLTATAVVDVSRFSSAAARVESLSLHARAIGPAALPRLDVELAAKGIEVGERRFGSLSARASGTTERLLVNATIRKNEKRRADIAATVSVEPVVSLAEPVVTVVSPEGDITVHANLVALDEGRVRVQGFELSGAGSLNADAEFDDTRAQSRFTATDLQVARVLGAFEIATPLTNGILSAEGTISGPYRAMRAKLLAHARSIDVDRIRGGTVDVDLGLEKRIITGGVEVKLGPSQFMARMDDVELPQPPFSRQSLLTTTGSVVLVGSVELDRVAPMLRAAGVPVERAQGVVRMDMSVENWKQDNAGPRASLRIHTQRLRLVEQRPPRSDVASVSAAIETQPRSLEGVDLDLNLLVDAVGQRTDLAARLFDRQGDLVRVDAKVETANLLNVRTLTDLENVPLTVQVSAPNRELSRMPPVVRPQVMHGQLSADFLLAGSIREPRLVGRAEVHGLKSRKERRGLDVLLRVGYARDGGVITLEGNSRRRQVATFASSWTGDLLTAANTSQGTTPFALDANLHLAGFPVGIVPALSDRGIRGGLDLDLRLEDLGKDAKLDAKLDGRRLRLGDVHLDRLDVTVQGNDEALSAKVDAGQGRGRLGVDLKTPMRWGAALVPAIDPHAHATVDATQFPVATAAPLLQGFVSEVDGFLDANLDVQLTDDAPHMKGRAELRRGVAHVPQIGQRFSDISARVSIAGGDIKLDSLEARGTTGKLRVQAQAHLRGSELESVRGTVDIAGKEKLPITYEGVEIGDAWGHLDLGYQRVDGAQEIRVDVPSLHVELPNASMNNVQDLGADQHISVGVYRADGTFAALPLQPLKSSESDVSDEAPMETRIRIHLGDSVWIERAGQAKVQLAGDLVMISAKETRLDGEIELRSGKLDVKGKTFEVERGTVAFAGTDTSNPVITATARWDSPVGYAVFADYSGTVEAGKLRLHSEPQLTQNEIISLLLFGSPEGSLGANDSGGGAAAAAVGIAGDSAVKGFNRVVSDFTNLEVSARIDTSTGSARPELVVQVSPRVTTRVTRALGQPAPGQSPDRTFLTLELRLRRNWALSGVVGDRGASWLDLLWRKRY